ncbi:MAG: nitrilase-related carbon-nitrogen hydrolase [Dysosmobacter sp.]
MRDGFITVACGAPKLRLADCDYNAEQTFTIMRKAEQAGVKVLVLPELGLTGYTCGDLFYQDTLLRGAEQALSTVLEATRNLEVVTAVGLPVRIINKLYNCAAIIKKERSWAWCPRPICPITANFTKSASLPRRRRASRSTWTGFAGRRCSSAPSSCSGARMPGTGAGL